jgi:hypothetical protein
VDAYIDLNRGGTSKKMFIGDINEDKVWEEAGHFQYDFSICTHTLEDIRSPDFVIRKLNSISKAGFISMPNKHTELSCIESVYWVGYYHHRWIFTLLENDKLLIVAKLPLTNYFIKSNRLIHKIGRINSDLIAAILKRKFLRCPAVPSIEWIQKKKLSVNFELGFIWEGNFDYEFAKDDYLATNMFEAAQFYRSQLKEGL